MMMRNVAGDRATDAKIEQPKVSDQCHEQRPDAIRRATQMVNDKRRKKKTDDRNEQERPPIRNCVLVKARGALRSFHEWVNAKLKSN